MYKLLGILMVMVVLTPVSFAMESDALAEELSAYMVFSDYGGGVILAEQIPAKDYENTVVIDTRNVVSFLKGHIPGAINIEWRQVLTERDRIPKDRMVLLYCDIGILSAFAAFGLRAAGWDNVRILQGGLTEWRAKGGFDAYRNAVQTAQN